MSKPFRLGLVMDLALGWRTNYHNWVQHFPQDMNVEPTWIVLSDDKSLWIDKVPGIPNRIKKRLRASLMLREGLRQGPFDATFIATSSALTTLPRYMKAHPCFLYIDSTPKQLFEFGDYYHWYPSKNPRVEQWKHQKRAAGYQSALGVFSTSQWAANSVVADYGASPANMHDLPYGVDMNQWQPSDPSLKAAKEGCDLLFVGGDFVRKGGPLLLDWAAKTEATGWRLHLVTPHAVKTDDPRISVYHDMTSNDPRLQKLYTQADIFVLPTIADCFSLAGIEALASGIPLLIGDTGGTSEVVQTGKTGYLLPQNDPSVLSQNLASLIGNPSLRAEMGYAARADAEERFSAPNLVKRAVQIMMKRV
ncbi:MAG: glycosyltransferase family 4 protein [Janthinobacterium lividum]